MDYAIGLFVCLLMIQSIWAFILFKYKRSNYQIHISFEILSILMVVYSIVIIGFGLIYYILSHHLEVLIEVGQVSSHSTLGRLISSIYFSGVTMLTIGYGDIVPTGIARAIALLQALIGYLLPASFFLKIIQLSQRTNQ